MDSVSPAVERDVGFKVGEEPVLTVYDFILNKHREDAEAFLRDPNVETAITEIDPHGKNRDEIAAMRRAKDEAVEALKRK